MTEQYKIFNGNSLDICKTIDSNSVQLIITSPPYFNQRNYSDGNPNEIGIEESPLSYVYNIKSLGVELFRILKNDGSFFLNIDDKYASKNYHEINCKKDSMMMIPERISIELMNIGFLLREKIIWKKRNPLIESYSNRRQRCWEPFFVFTKSDDYYYNPNSIKDNLSIRTEKQLSMMDKEKYLKDGRLMVGNKSGDIDVMPEFKKRGIDPFSRCPICGSYNFRHVGIQSGKPHLILCKTKGSPKNIIETAVGHSHDIHFAQFPPDLIIEPILTSSREGNVVLDPFMGGGTTGVVALKNNRKFMGIDLVPEYCDISKKNLENVIQYSENLFTESNRPIDKESCRPWGNKKS